MLQTYSYSMGMSVFLHYNHLQATSRLTDRRDPILSEFTSENPCGKPPCFSSAVRTFSLPDSRIKSDNGETRRECTGEWRKREPQLCIRKKYFMAFFFKRVFSLRISETGKDIFDGKKEKAERNPL